MSNAEDFDAIKSYFSGQTPKTAKGVDIKTSFNAWTPSVSTFLGVSDSDLTKAKSLRDDYNTAEMPAATAAVKASPGLTTAETKYVLGMPVVNTTGMTPEQAHQAVWSAKSATPPPPNSAFATGQKTSVAATSHKTVKQGMNDSKTSTDVAAWQKILGINADGKFGAQTTAATKTWQKNHGLKEDGIVGPTTWAKAEEVANPNGSPVVATPEQVAAATGQNTVKPAVAAAPAAAKSTVAAATTGAVTVPATHALGGVEEPTNFQKAVAKVNADTKAAEAGMLSVSKSVPKWAWAGAIGVFLAAAAYAVFGHPKFDQRKKFEQQKRGD